MQEIVFFFNITKFSPMFSYRHILHLCLICLYNTFWVSFCMWCKLRKWIKVLFVLFCICVPNCTSTTCFFKKSFSFQLSLHICENQLTVYKVPFLDSLFYCIYPFSTFHQYHSLDGCNFMISFEIKLWERVVQLYSSV